MSDQLSLIETPQPPGSSPTGRFRASIRRRPVWWFIGITFGLSWLAWLPFILSSSGLGVIALDIPPVFGSRQIIGMLPGAYLGPVTAAFIVTAAADGRAGLRRWAHRLVHWRVGWRWYFCVLAGVPVVILIATCFLPGALSHLQAPSLTALALYPVVLLLQMVTTAAAEEPGWRDFALPRLQNRFGAFAGTMVLGTVWGAWHLPLFLTEWAGWPDVSWVQPVEFMVSCLPLSLVMTWVFNRSGESLPLIMLFHASINTVYSLIWSEVFPTLNAHTDTLHTQLIATTAVALVLLVVTRGRLGLAGRAQTE